MTTADDLKAAIKYTSKFIGAQARLSEEKVREIKKHLLNGMTAYALAPMYGVTPNLIYKILHGTAWKHVPWEGGMYGGMPEWMQKVARERRQTASKLRGSSHVSAEIFNSTQIPDPEREREIAEHMLSKVIKKEIELTPQAEEFFERTIPNWRDKIDPKKAAERYAALAKDRPPRVYVDPASKEDYVKPAMMAQRPRQLTWMDLDDPGLHPSIQAMFEKDIAQDREKRKAIERMRKGEPA